MMRGVFPSITATAEFVVPMKCRVSSVDLYKQTCTVLAHTEIDTNDRAFNLLLAAI